jgi:predicted secreted protein
MMRQVAVLVLAGLFALGAVAEERGLDYNLVQLEASATAEVPNDQMRVTLAVEHEARSAAELPALVNADMGWALGVAKKHAAVRAQTGEYTTQPQYASTRIVGWRAMQYLQLEGEDFGAVGALVTALQEKLQVKGMEFQPTRATREKVEADLTRAALEAFGARANLIADAMNAKGYEVVEVAVGGGGVQPVYKARSRGMEMMAMASDASAPVAIEGGTVTLTVTANGRIQLR